MKSMLHHLVSGLSSVFRSRKQESTTENGSSGNSRPFAKVDNSPFLMAYFSTFLYALFGFIQKSCGSVFGLTKLSTMNRIRVNALGFLTVFLFFGTVQNTSAQTTLAVGDLSIIGFNSNTPDNFAFVAWVGIADNTYIKFTDNAFLGTGSANATNNGRGGENYVIWRNNTGSTIAAGTVIRIQEATTSLGTIVSGSLNGISNSGDQIFAYQGPATSGANPDWSSNANPTTFNGTILFGLNFGTNWLPSGTPSSNTSYLPSQLNVANGNIALTTASTSRGQYTGSRNNQSTLAAYKALVNTSTNWTTATGTGTITLDLTNFTTANPVISASGTLAAVNTTYGTASASPTSFNVSGASMAAGILVTPPAGYEVSLSSGSGYAPTVTVGSSGTIASTPVYVRLTSTATVAGSPYSGDIVLSSTGATSVNVATVSSSVAAKALTITGISANNKLFDGNTDATLSGTASLVGVVNGDVVTLGGTPVATFASSAVGTGIAVSVTGYTISGGGAGNYTLTQPSLTADITSSPAPVINSLLTASAVYGEVAATYTITATETPTSFNATGLPSGLTVNTTNGEITGTPTAAPGAYNVNISATNIGGTGNATLVYTITPKNLTVTGATADAKVYDRTTTATISGSTLVGVVGADVVTISNTGTFASATAGTAIAVTSTQILGGADAAKYTVTLPTGLIADITPKALTISGAAAASKVFDGNNTATITGTLTGVIAPDDATVTFSGTFASTAIGNGIAVTSTSTLGGVDAANYTLTQPAGLTANITEPTIYVNTFTGVSACPTNGNVPTMATNATGTPLLRSTITCNSTANVFNSTTLNATASLSATSYIEFSATATAGNVLNVSSISFFRQASNSAPNQLEVRYSTDGFATFTTWGAAPNSSPSGTVATWDFANFTTPTAGTVTFRIYPFGTQRADLTGTSSTTGTFRVDDVTIYGTVSAAPSPVISTAGTLTALTTTYGTASATSSFDVSGADMQDGILVSAPAGFEVSTTAGSGYATSITVGAAGTITSTTVYVRLAATTAVGTYSGNVALTSAGAAAVNVATASSTVSPVTLPVNGLTANNKTFDGTTTATLSGTPTLTGIVPGDEPNVILGGTPVANFATSAIGTGIAVTVTGYTISGSAAGNYTLVQPTGLTADIVALAAPAINSSLTASATYGEASATYTITATETPTSFNATGLPAGLSVNTSNGEITGTPAVVGTFNVNISASNLGGTGNATLVYTVAPKALTITGATADNKVYDRTTSAIISGSTLVGIVGADDVTVSNTGTFAAATAGTSIAVTSTQTLSGADASKYSLTLPTGLTANITPKALTIGSAAALNKNFDTTTDATITGTLTGVIAPDLVTFNGTGIFASSAVGTGIAVTSTATLSGADAANYSLTQPTGLTANIIAVPTFTYGNLVVTRVGAGTAALTNAANPIFLNEYTTAGTAGIIVALPTTTTGNTNRILCSGTATSEGQLALSTDGQYLTVGGYDAVVGQASVNSTAGIPRVIARVNSAGAIATSVMPSTIHASGFRSVVTTDGSRYWTAGNGVGVTSLLHQGNTTPVTPTTISSTLTNLRTVNVFNNQLYVSTGSGSQGIYRVGTGVPTTSGQAAVISLPQNGLYAYQMVNRGGSNWNCYAGTDSAPGIYKWSSTDNGATWTARGSVANVLPIYGITAANNGTSVDLYATTVSSILKLTDATAFNATIAGTISTIVTAPTNTFFRGIAFAPIAANAPLIATVGSPAAVNTIYGTASATPGTFTISGNNLSTDIVLTAPAGFEISKDGISYASTQTLVQTAGVVASTTISVRLAATTLAGTYSGNITCVSSPANTVNIAIPSSIVSPLALTVTGATADSKVYDRTTTATISGSVLSSTVNGDVITVSGGGSFADFNVGTAKPVTAALTLSGTNASSYTLTQPTGLTADITAKDLTIAGAAANNKAYDGTTSATISGTLTGVIAPDDVTLNSTSAAFDSPGVGTAIPVTSNSTLSGADFANYNLIDATGLSADITPKQLTIASATAQNKVFDGNTAATITGTLVGVVAPDDVNLVGTGTFATSAVGVGIAVTSTSTLTGADILNYSLLQPVGLTANITAAALLPQTITFNPLADVEYGSGTFNLTATADSGLTVSYQSSNTNVATVSGNVVTVVGVGSTTITALQAGDAIYDSAIPVDQNLNVTPKALTVTATADNKVYDGNTNATISGTLYGIVGADVVTFTGLGLFDSPDAANGVNVTSFSSLGGAQAANYTLTQPTGLTANITPLGLNVLGAAGANKVYDGTTVATINGASLDGVIGLDDVTAVGAGTFATKNVGTAIAITANITLAGAQAANYTINAQPTGLSANITPKALTISGLLGGNKVYDGTVAASVIGTGTLSGVELGDVVTLAGTPVVVFATAAAGIAKPINVSGYTISGADAANYTLTQPTGVTGDITPAPLTLSNASALNKPFDGNTNAIVNGLLQGIISPDVVTLIGTGTFATSAEGTGIAVTSTSTLGGAAAANYTLTQPTGLTANITAPATVFAVGDLSIIGFQLNAPDTFTFVTWVDITEGTLIKFTDNAFLSNGSANLPNNARGSENFIIWKNQSGVIPAGTVISITDNTSAGITSLGTIVSGNLSGLSAAGDNIFAYQGPATSGAFPDFASVAATTTFNGTVLFGLYAQGTSLLTSWQTTGAGTTTNSYLPSELSASTSNIALASNASRGQYTGLRNNQLTFTAYKAQVTNPANWTTASGAGVVTMDLTPFTLMSPAAITATGTLSAVDTVYGTASVTPTTFTVSGTDLENNLVLTAPTGFEISQDGIVYATTQTLIPISGTVASTTISVRLAATTVAGTYSGNITCVSAPAVTVNIATAASTVSPLAITVTGAVADNKVYDRTTTATISGAIAAGTVNGDLITVSGGGTFASFNVGTAIAVTPSLTLSGTNAASYTFTQPTGLSADITPKALTIGSAAASNKLFDGNTDAVITGTLTGVIAPDAVAFNGTGTFASAALGTGIAVTSTSTLSGIDAGNYTLTQPLGLTANITAAPLLPQTITFNALANVVYGDANFNLTATASSGLTVSYISSNTNVATILGNVVTIVGVGTTTITASQSGDSVYDAAPVVNQTLTVTPKALTVSATADNKVYDRTTAATITGTLVGIVGLDVVTFSGTGTFATANAGTAIAVTSTSTISGANVANYTLTQPTGLTADITPKALTISGAAASNKVFDGTDAAVITGTLSGIISPDVVTLVGTGTFASSAVGTGIAVTSTSTLAGAAAANYSLTQPTGLTANITVAPTTFAVGDISIIGFQLNAPDSFAFATWVDINPNTYIKFTDNAFLSSGSANATNNGRGGENFVIWRNNGGVIPAGSVITIVDNSTSAVTNNGTIVSGNLSGLSGSGDNIFAYQGAAISGAFPDWSTNTNPTTFNGTILFGLYAQGTSATASWLTAGIATANNSYLPSQLNVPNGNIAFGSLSSRGQYTGSRNNQVTFNAYKALVTNPANWTAASGAGTLTLNTTSFTLATAPTASVISGDATICAGESTNLTVAVTGGTSPFTVVYTDGTNNFTVNSYVSGANISVTPASTTTYTLVSVTDANLLVGTGNAGSSIVTVNTPTIWYADADSDTFGDVATTLSACDQPLGYVANGSDCDPLDGTKWQLASFFVDTDADGYDNGSASVCSGVGAPAGYSATTSGSDCNDNDNTTWQQNNLFTDGDGDGWALNATTTPICYGATVPAGYVLVSLGVDCDDTDALLTNNCGGGSVVNLTMFIEGYYLGGSTMNSVRNNQDGVSALDEVELMTIELHDATAPYALVESVTGMLKTDGTLTCTFTTAPAGSYYIAVKGVNILQTWTATPQAVGAAPLNYDFSSAGNQAFGDMREMEPGVFAFYNGDVNQDDAIDNSDLDPILPDIETSNFGVLATDLNGDGAVDNSDLDNILISIDQSRFANYPL